MADWSLKFKWQYDYAKSWLADADAFDDDWKKTVVHLQSLLGTDGFSLAHAAALSEVRKKSRKASGKTVPQGEGILTAVKSAGNTGVMDQSAKMRASALHFLSHTYLIHASGKSNVWVHSSPKALKHWPSIHFNSWASTTNEVKTLLKDQDEHFDSAAKKHLAHASRQSLHWCQKTNLVLSTAAAKKGNEKARAIVKRWFADPSTTEAQLDGYITTLSNGFKKITSMLNKSTMILTDYMPLRNATAADEISFLNAEAFTFRDRNEGLDVVYIEKNFLVDNPGNVIKGSRNWTRILVHELTHLVANTIDVVNGKSRYAWYGIGPHAGYPGSQCITNADNWAFFCADAAGGLTKQEITAATKIV